MKILMAMMGLDIGGAETHVAELARDLTRRGHCVVIASAGGAYVPMLEAQGIRCPLVPMDQRDPRKMARSLRLLRRLIAEERPDLVHAHARIPAFLCGKLQKRMGFPFITTAHWVFAVTPLLRRMTNWGSQTVAVSQDIRSYLMREYQVPADQISVTINGIDTDQFSPHRQEPALRQSLGLGDGPVICHVSRLDEGRALAAQELLSAMPALLGRFPGLQLLVVGGGDRASQLQAQAQAVNAAAGAPAVVMTGPRTDVAALLSLGDVFVGSSRAVLEAMSEEKPVVMAGNEGYMGILRPERLAQAVETNFCYRGSGRTTTAAALIEDLSALLSMPPEQRQALGQYGRQVILSQYSVARMTEDYLRAYDQLLHPKKPLYAAISGYYGYDNLGDDAILLAQSRMLSQLERPIRLTVLSRSPKKTARRFGLPAVPRFSPLRVYGAIRRSDLLISGGGSLMQDRTSLRSLWYYLRVIHTALGLGKPAVLLSNGVGPLDRPRSQDAVRRAVERCTAVSLRDADSLTLLRDIGVTRPDIVVTADPTFTLTPADDGPEQLRAMGIPEGKRLIGVSLRQISHQRSDPDAFAALCDRLSQETGRTIVFLVMQDPDDAQISRAVQKKMAARSFVAPAFQNPETMLGLIGCMDLLVSTRLHTILFAAKQRVPVVGCVYDPKVQSFLRQLDMPSCGSPAALDVAGAVSAAKDLLSRRAEVQAHLDEIVRTMEQEARGIGPWLLAQLDAHSDTV